MAIVLVFVLGIGNFAVHRAVLDSRHPLVAGLPLGESAAWITLALEFAALFGALLLVGNGRPGWSLGYLGYSVLNGLAGWLILTRRI